MNFGIRLWLSAKRKVSYHFEGLHWISRSIWGVLSSVHLSLLTHEHIGCLSIYLGHLYFLSKVFCDFQSVSQYFKKLSSWFKCTGWGENLLWVTMSHPLIILKCFWVTNFFSFFFLLKLTQEFSFFHWNESFCFEDWNVFPANVDFQNVCCWHADESVISRAGGRHSYLTTPSFFLVLWLPETCVLWERTSLLDSCWEPPPTH